MTPKRHRNQHTAHWRAIEGAIRDAVNAHPDIEIPRQRMASIVKRCVGAVLALEARAGSPAEEAPGHLLAGRDGAGSSQGPAPDRHRSVDDVGEAVPGHLAAGHGQRAAGEPLAAGFGISGTRGTPDRDGRPAARSVALRGCA